MSTEDLVKEELVIEGESEFEMPDTIESVAIELVPDEDETGIDDVIETSLPENIEEDLISMQQVFILACELEERYKDSETVDDNLELKNLFELAGLDCVEVIFNTTPTESVANKVALDKLLKIISTKYAELFGNVTGKIVTTVNGLLEAVKEIPKGDLEVIESIRSRTSSVQTNYITKDQKVLNAFTTPISEFRELLESDYVVSPKFDIIYKMCDRVLDSKDKCFSTISAYLEVVYKDWLSSEEKLKNIGLFINEDFDGSFRGRLDILNLRDKLDSIAINIGRISEIYNAYPDGNIFELMSEVLFHEL